ncbi:hypothetical protein [Methylocystis parvus]|uniref:hypothetical protein n=1 Tax=Methylocystis parvus TaxID=134 RepID=UPI003C71CA88
MTGLTAEAAVERVQSDARARMQRQTDPYLRDRLHDLDDLANRLLHQLTGQSYVADRESVPDNAIIVARTMGRPRCSIMTARGCAGSCSRKAARRAMSPSWRAPSACRPSASSPA